VGFSREKERKRDTAVRKTPKREKGGFQQEGRQEGRLRGGKKLGAKEKKRSGGPKWRKDKKPRQPQEGNLGSNDYRQESVLTTLDQLGCSRAALHLNHMRSRTDLHPG